MIRRSDERAAVPRTDIATEHDIERLVVAFYRDAAMDDVLGPVFEAAHVHWPDHVATLTAFWSWQILGIRGYEGNPLVAHRPSHARTPFGDAHFERWLSLFLDTVDAEFAGPRAEAAKVRATKMANALQRLLRDEWASGDESGEPVILRRAAASATGQAQGDGGAPASRS